MKHLIIGLTNSLIVIVLVSCSPAQTTTAAITPLKETPESLIMTPTRASVPPLTEEEIHQKMNSYYETNGGCELPCWWGIIPGESTIQKVERELVPLADYYSGDDDTQDTFMGMDRYTLNFPTIETIAPRRGFWVTLLSTDDIIQGVIIADIFAKPYVDFKLAEYLQYFGEPHRVFIFVDYEFVLLTLTYPEQGVILTNGAFSHDLGSDLQFELCPGEVEFLLKFYNPDLERWDRIVGISIGGDNEFPLEEISGFTPHDFYEIMKNPDSRECVYGEIEIED